MLCTIPHTPIFNNSNSSYNYKSIGLWGVLPDELILKIFSFCAIKDITSLNSVSKAYADLANQAFVWKSVAVKLDLTDDIQTAASCGRCIKDLCIQTLSCTKIGHKKLGKVSDLKLAPRNPGFVQRLQDYKLQGFHLLPASSAQELMELPDTIALIKSQHFQQLDPQKLQSLHHIAQQKVGTCSFDILNYTDYAVNLNDKRILQVNAKATNITFTADDCQLIVFISQNILHVLHKDKGKSQCIDLKCRLHALKDLEAKDMLDDFYG